MLLTVTPASEVENVEYSLTDDAVVELVSADRDVERGTVTFKLTGLTLGTATLVAVLEDKVAECAITVAPVEVERIVLDVETLDLNVSDIYTLGVVIEPSNASNPSVDWSSDNNDVATVSRGLITGVGEGTAVITAAVGEVKATCTVNVHIVEAESITLDVTEREIVEGETFIVNATVLPENITDRTMSWSLSNEGIVNYEIIDVNESDNIMAVRVEGVAAGEAVLTVTCGKVKAECAITVIPKEEPVKDPEIGDYFYSDGTWSDGKAAPKDGKTVIGIIFSTDASRISDTEKAFGYTHGLVMAAKSAHAPDADFTRYAIGFDSEFALIPNKKLGTAWFADINGYAWTKAIVDAYPGELIRAFPAFDWTTTDFSPSAPTGTSGWYVPSIGQVWDMLANLGGDEVAEHLKNLESFSSDITYLYREGELTLTYNPIEKLNSWLEQIPEVDRELFVPVLSRGSGIGVCDIMSSSLYDNTDGAVCVFWLYDNGQIEPVTDWTDQALVCRPILSF